MSTFNILLGIFDIIIAWLLIGFIIRHDSATNVKHGKVYQMLTWFSFKVMPK